MYICYKCRSLYLLILLQTENVRQELIFFFFLSHFLSLVFSFPFTFYSVLWFRAVDGVKTSSQSHRSTEHFKVHRALHLTGFCGQSCECEILKIIVLEFPMNLHYGASITIKQTKKFWQNEFSIYAVSSKNYLPQAALAWPRHPVIVFSYWFISFYYIFGQFFLHSLWIWIERQTTKIEGHRLFFFFGSEKMYRPSKKKTWHHPLPWSKRMRGWGGGEEQRRLRSPVEDWGLRVVVTGSLKPPTQPDQQPLKSNSSQKWT